MVLSSSSSSSAFWLGSLIVSLDLLLVRAYDNSRSDNVSLEPDVVYASLMHLSSLACRVSMIKTQKLWRTSPSQQLPRTFAMTYNEPTHRAGPIPSKKQRGKRPTKSATALRSSKVKKIEARKRSDDLEARAMAFVRLTLLLSILCD